MLYIIRIRSYFWYFAMNFFAVDFIGLNIYLMNLWMLCMKEHLYFN